MEKGKRIFLWGMMGVGKSTFGKHVAGKFDVPFIDLDEWIATQEGCSIAEIFHHRGEPYFREIEHAGLKDIIKNNPSFVLATGGGTPCFYESAHLMNLAGLTIYLQIDTTILVERVISAPGERPLLQSIDDLQLLGHLDQLKEDRKDFYEKAQLHITLSGSLDKDMEIIQSEMEKVLQ